MLQTTRSRGLGLVLTGLAGLAVSQIAEAATAESGANLASVRRYAGAEDQQPCQAVLLKSRDGLGDAAQAHVILVDTSASQVGEHRQHAFGVLKSLLKSLPAGDTVRLVAVDVAAETLTSEFVAPQSEAIDMALEELDARVPLGATNLPGAIAAARDMLPEDRPGSIVYIGDGVSTADIVTPAEMETLVERLRARRIAVHSYGVGPVMNLHLLGIFGQQTGGAVHFDSQIDSKWDPRRKREDATRTPEQNAAERGRKLAQAVILPIVRPTEIDLPANVAVSPRTALPLRSDRETIYLVRGDLPADTTITARTRNESQTWNLAAPTEGTHDAFLAAFLDRVDREGPLANSLAGSALLNVVQDEFSGRVAGMVNFGKLALAEKDYDRVQQVVDAVRRLDPSNRELARVERASRKFQAKAVAFAQNDEDAEPAAAEGQTPTPPEPGIGGDADNADLAPRTEPNPGGSLLDDERRAIRIRTQKLKQQVNDMIGVVRQADDPQAGLEELDRTLSTVRSSIDVEPEVRLQLEKQLRSERLAAAEPAGSAAAGGDPGTGTDRAVRIAGAAGRTARAGRGTPGEPDRPRAGVDAGRPARRRRRLRGSRSGGRRGGRPAARQRDDGGGLLRRGSGDPAQSLVPVAGAAGRPVLGDDAPGRTVPHPVPGRTAGPVPAGVGVGGAHGTA